MIVQVLDYYDSGNAIANIALNFYRFTKELHFQSKIVARLIEKKDDFIDSLDALREVSDNDIIMYHLCIGTPLNNEICLYKGKKVLVYHNITPPDLLLDFDEVIAEACNDGLLELKDNLLFFDYAICDSDFNKNDLVKLGFNENNICVIPPFISSEDFKKTPNDELIKKYKDGKTNFLFVGRLSPHKKQDDLIKFFAHYKKNVNSNSRLFLAGNGNEKYIDYLQNLISELQVNDVIMTRQIPFRDLLAYYNVADFFVCMSEHEGYGMPLIEAMNFNIPVIAYNSSAISNTLSGAGILLDSKEPQYVSEVIEKLRSSPNFKTKIIEKQNEMLSALTKEKIFEKFSQAVDLLKKTPSFSKQKNDYDVVIVIKASDWDVAKANLPFIKRNLNPKKVIIISNKSLKEKLYFMEDLVFIDEDSLFPELTLSNIKKLLKTRGIAENFAGWYLQQFLKLGYAFICQDNYYLIWDADSIPLNKIDMIDSKSIEPFFDMKPEFVESYFLTIRNLFSFDKKEPESFIAEHMLFNTAIVREMLQTLQTQKDSFFEAIIKKTDFSQNAKSFSEFETFGTYCDYKYPGLYKKRHLRTFRAGKIFLGANPSYSTLKWASDSIDIISFEFIQITNKTAEKLSKSISFRTNYSFSDFVQNMLFFDNLSGNIFFECEDANVKMDYPYSKQPVFIEKTSTIKLKEIVSPPKNIAKTQDSNSCIEKKHAINVGKRIFSYFECFSNKVKQIKVPLIQLILLFALTLLVFGNVQTALFKQQVISTERLQSASFLLMLFGIVLLLLAYLCNPIKSFLRFAKKVIKWIFKL